MASLVATVFCEWAEGVARWVWPHVFYLSTVRGCGEMEDAAGYPMLDVAVKRPEEKTRFSADFAPDSGTSAAWLLCKYIQNMNYVNAKSTHHPFLARLALLETFCELSRLKRTTPFPSRAITRSKIVGSCESFVFCPTCLTILLNLVA